MKTLSYALVAAALLAAAPAAAGESNPGENQFHGSSTLRSYGAWAKAAEDTAVVVRGDGTVEQARLGQARISQIQDQIAETDFIRPYAN